MGKWAWLAELPGAYPQLPRDAHPWALAFFFFFLLMTTPKRWELGGRSCSNRHTWRGRKGLEERTSAQAEVNMAISKRLGVSPTPVGILPGGRNKE